MPYKKGKRKTGGRKPGIQNKITVTVKQTVLEVFNEIQSDPKNNLLAFAKKYPRDFYQLAAKLIPTEVNNSGYMELTLKSFSWESFYPNKSNSR